MNTTASDNFTVTQQGILAHDNNPSFAAGLELFAEELPAQNDLLIISTRGTAGTISSIGSTVGTGSTVSSL